nr:MAG TPA: hypothetical protein [Caudoviricetes sp.]
MAAALTGCDATGKAVGCAAQPVRLAVSSSDSSSSGIDKSLAILDYLVDRLLAGLFFVALGGLVGGFGGFIARISLAPPGLPIIIGNRLTVVIGAEQGASHQQQRDYIGKYFHASTFNALSYSA